MSRLLFWLTICLAAALFLLVLLTPPFNDGLSGVLALFAGDPVVRRTTVASAIGLTVTAFVFFSTPAKERERKSSDGLPPRTPVIGA
jgi:preprotein translocase subunit SecG